MPTPNKDSTANDAMINEGGHADASSAKRHWEDIARHAGQRIRELSDEAGHDLSDAGHTVTAKIRDNPIQSSLIALSIGVVVGLLYRR